MRKESEREELIRIITEKPDLADAILTIIAAIIQNRVQPTADEKRDR